MTTVYVAGQETLIGRALARRLPGRLVNQLPADFVIVAGGKSGGIRANQKFPATLMLDNLRQLTEVIHAAHEHRVKRLLYLASSCCYPKLAAQPMTTDALLTGPLEPTSEAYALAKIAGLKLCQAYRQEHGDDFIGAVVADAFGPGEVHDVEDLHVVPALLLRMHRAQRAGQPVFDIWGSGNPRREFIFADDVADACLFVLEHPDTPPLFNLGGGTDTSIRELAMLIREIVGYTGELRCDMSKPDGMPLKKLDSTVLQNLGWQAQTPLKSALEATYQSLLQETSHAR